MNQQGLPMVFSRACSALAILCIGSALCADDVADTAATIDQQIFNRLRDEKINPTEPATDAEFLRRVWLDIAGTIPPADNVRRFLDDTRPDKRQRLVKRLLRDAGYANHFATFWRDILLPELQSDEQVQQLLPGFNAWLRQHLELDTPYDQLVREIVTTRLVGSGRDAQLTLSGNERSAIAFYQAKDVAPANLAAATSRIFLGIRLECAQCHDHPFDDWKQHQFWSYAAFFAGIERQSDDGVLGPVSEVFDRRELTIPDTESVVQAGFLDGNNPRWRRGLTSRQILADWITSKENPYFAKTVVNRIWGKFFGVGLVDPVDDFTASNPSSHPELLDFLAKDFVSHRFDVKFLIHAITSSRAYQLSSGTVADASPQSFASMAVKGMTPEQLLSSLAEASGLGAQTLTQAEAGTMSPRAEILELFANDTDSATNQQTSILQALALMNGSLITSAVDAQRSPRMANLINSSLSPEQRVELLFLATLSRRPADGEVRRIVEFVNSIRTRQGDQQPWSHVFWALLNSAEFASNH